MTDNDKMHEITLYTDGSALKPGESKALSPEPLSRAADDVQTKYA